MRRQSLTILYGLHRDVLKIADNSKNNILSPKKAEIGHILTIYGLNLEKIGPSIQSLGKNDPEKFKNLISNLI